MRGGERGRGGRGRGREGVAQGPAHAKAGSVYRPKYYIVTFKARLRVT